MPAACNAQLRVGGGCLPSFHSVLQRCQCHAAGLTQPRCCWLQLDWRPLLPHIRVPCLNLVGELSGVFPEAGCRAVGDLIPNCHTVSAAACQLELLPLAQPAAGWVYVLQSGRIFSVAAIRTRGITLHWQLW